jgi:hypothetical protein
VGHVIKWLLVEKFLLGWDTSSKNKIAVMTIIIATAATPNRVTAGSIQGDRNENKWYTVDTATNRGAL